MRKLGLIIDVGDLVTILIWDDELKTVVTKQVINQDNKEYKILSIVEYFSDTNTMTLITDFKLTKKETVFSFFFISQWGEIWGSNPCIPEPQSGVLTTSPIPPYTCSKNTIIF